MATQKKNTPNAGDPAALANASLQLGKMIDTLFKTGRYPLVAIGIGAIFTFAYVIALQSAFLTNKAELPNQWYIVIALGALLMLGGFASVIIAGTRVHGNVQRTIKSYEKTIETAHEFSQESIKAVRHLNELLFTHVDTVAQVLDAAQPILNMFGGALFTSSRYLESDLVAFSNRAQEVITNVETAIIEADFNALLRYRDEIGQIAETTKQIVARVKNNEWAAGRVTDLTDSISSARDAALAYSDSATKVYERMNATALPIITHCQAAKKLPLIGPWLDQQGISGQVDGLQRMLGVLQKAQAANMAVRAAISAPGKDNLDAALLHMQSLRTELKASIDEHA
jgi:hypothetical protein